jgi:hypothetical protein
MLFAVRQPRSEERATKLQAKSPRIGAQLSSLFEDSDKAKIWPFGVSLARSFKAELRKIFKVAAWRRDDKGNFDPSVIDRDCCVIVQAARAAWTQVCGSDVTEPAFAQCGLVPFSEAPLSSKYAFAGDQDMEMKKKQKNPSNLSIPSSVPASEEMIRWRIDENGLQVDSLQSILSFPGS